MRERRDNEDDLNAGFKAILDVALIVFFCITLIGECYALYTKNYTLRFYTRTLLVPFLFLRIFNKEVFFSMHFFVYLSLLLTWFGDILNLITDLKIQYLASAFYSVSYIAFGIVFYNFSDKKRIFINYFFFAFFAVIGVIVFFYFYFPALSDKLPVIHIVTHALILLFALLWAFNTSKDLGNIGIKYFVPSVILMILTNVVYAIDFYKINTLYTKFYYFERHTSIDVVVAILFSSYVILFTQGIRQLKYVGIKQKNKEQEEYDLLEID